MTTLRSVRDVATTVAAAHHRGRRLVIGIAGAPGAGKSTVAAELVELLGPTTALLPMDGFHLPQATLVELGRRERMGAPDTFDVDGFLATLTALRDATDTVLAPDFDRTVEEAVPDALEYPLGVDTVVVEGNYLLLDTDGWERVLPLLDLSFFVGVERGIRLDRLIERHVRFGKTRADATAWALGPDESNARLIEATAVRADHLVELPVALEPLPPGSLAPAGDDPVG